MRIGERLDAGSYPLDGLRFSRSQSMVRARLSPDFFTATAYRAPLLITQRGKILLLHLACLGYRAIALYSDKFESLLFVPCGLESFPFTTCFGGFVPFAQIECTVSNHREVGRTIALTSACPIFIESHIQYPMQWILHTPVCSRNPSELPGFSGIQTADEITHIPGLSRFTVSQTAYFDDAVKVRQQFPLSQ